MQDLTWSKMLSVDVEEIDEDHRRLVALFNLLTHSLADGDAADYIEAVLEELVSCTAWHFRHEERLMLRFDYDGLAEHKAEHQELIDSAKALQQKFLENDKQLSAEDIEYLETWLTEHILTADMQLGSYLVAVM